MEELRNPIILFFGISLLSPPPRLAPEVEAVMDM